MLVPKRAPRELQVVPVGRSEVDPLDWLAVELERSFGVPCRCRTPWPFRDEWLDRERGQGCSNRIVDALVGELADPAEDSPSHWLVGVVEVDLFAPGRPFVFGEATVGGCCALVSLARLRAVPRGSAGDSMLRERVLKEALHELGHVAGLDHCTNPACVMAESYDAADIDPKGTEFCPICRATVGWLPTRSGG